ncbi:hypothetical protein RclHR1_20620005 [Rhizophagus clarus]|uniref:Reverse transcriptase domain-containing protein n=1 Tax=Rhizophagus clarus TaxID=94130 RepID=A0A2Z6R4X9_9GLOM|nr:hypothetical protein RclHR1_20620005 [Rhizophagus clarus]
MTDNNFNYDSFIRNPSNPIDIKNLSLQDSLFSSNSLSPPPFNSFNISSFNINGLKMHSQNKIELLNNFFSLKQISFGGIVDTHLHPKQMHFLAKRLSNYTVFSSILDTSQHVCSSGGVSLFIKNSLASHVHTYTSYSSRLLSVDLYFKGNVKLRIFIVYIPPTSDQTLRDDTINLLIQALSEAKRLVNFSDSLGTFHHADIISRIDYVWLCPLLKHFLLTSAIFDVRDLSFSDHNPVITYYDHSFLRSSIKLAHARQLNWHSHRIFSFDSVTPSQWEDFPLTLTNFVTNLPLPLPLALPDRWRSEYLPMDSVSPDIYNSLLSPPSLEEWLSTVSSMPNGKAPGPSMITYEMLKHLGPTTNSLLLILIHACFALADIPDLWRQTMVFPIPKLHEWHCQLKNTHPITLLEVIWKLRTCHDSIITLESIIHDANHNNSSLWILFQNISKVFDSDNFTMLKFALERIRLPASAIMLLLSLFMNCSNWIFTAHSDTSSYQVHIGIDQGEVISPLLWVIYIDPLLTVLNKEMMDPYILRSSILLLITTDNTSTIAINNLVFMNDSTLISSSKAGLEHMLSITEEFYMLNNTSANHQKYVLISNSLPLT